MFQVRAVKLRRRDSPWSYTETVTPTTADAPTIESITPGQRNAHRILGRAGQHGPSE